MESSRCPWVRYTVVPFSRSTVPEELGREICDVMLAIPRAFKRADYLPCILWGRTAQEIASCHTRDRIRVCGRLQSRIYTKLTDQGAEERTAYEISALTADILDEIL